MADQAGYEISERYKPGKNLVSSNVEGYTSSVFDYSSPGYVYDLVSNRDPESSRFAME